MSLNFSFIIIWEYLRLSHSDYLETKRTLVADDLIHPCSISRLASFGFRNCMQAALLHYSTVSL